MGFFSWRTQDTDRSIPSTYSNRDTFRVYMVNPVTGDIYAEDNYEGYGVFGGKDFYELVAELNGGGDRNDGIGISMRDSYVSPLLLENYENWRAYAGKIPEVCIFQGYFYPSEADEVKERINAYKRDIENLKKYIEEQKLKIAKEHRITLENGTLSEQQKKDFTNIRKITTCYYEINIKKAEEKILERELNIARAQNNWNFK